MKRFAEPITLMLLCLVGLALRWYRLDLISFRYDTADALFRARDIARGYQPFLGIVNSLGFHNPAGLPWLILPTLLFSPSPEIATAWFALLAMSGIYPVYAICRRWLGSWGFLIPCAAYAAMPNQVLASRVIWAQWLMPAIFAWVLWCVQQCLTAVELRQVRRYAIAAMALTWIGVAVHISGIVYLPLVLVAVYFALRHSKMSPAGFVTTALLGSLPILLLAPSAFDYLGVRSRPAVAKPAHIQKFESLMPPPEPFVTRLASSASGQFNLFASASQMNDISEPSPALRRLGIACKAADYILLALAFIGIAAAALYRDQRTRFRPGHLLLAWIIFPTILGCLLAQRANASYFSPGIPALLICTGAIALILGKSLSSRFTALVTTAIAVAIVAAYALFTVELLHSIDKARFVRGQYYIPLVEQRAFARQLVDRGVSHRRLQHLSGEWYQRPYDYLLHEVYKSPELTANPAWAVMEDDNLRSDEDARVSYFLPKATLHQGAVAAALFTDPHDAAKFIDAYYAIGKGDKSAIAQ